MKFDKDRKDWSGYGLSTPSGWNLRPLRPFGTKARQMAAAIFRDTEKLAPVFVRGSEALDIDDRLLWIGQWKAEAAKAAAYRPRLVRIPSETVTGYRLGDTFAVLGRELSQQAQLKARVEGEWIWNRDPWGFHGIVGVYLDCHGRKVVGITERFPAYDAYDKRYDDRFYRYYYLYGTDSLTCVCFADGSEGFAVTEDMASIPEHHLKMLRDSKWLF